MRLQNVNFDIELEIRGEKNSATTTPFSHPSLPLERAKLITQLSPA